jgi:hypothetical protein
MKKLKLTVALAAIFITFGACKAIQECKDRKESKKEQATCGHCGKTSCSSDCKASK